MKKNNKLENLKNKIFILNEKVASLTKGGLDAQCGDSSKSITILGKEYIAIDYKISSTITVWN